MISGGITPKVVESIKKMRSIVPSYVIFTEAIDNSAPIKEIVKEYILDQMKDYSLSVVSRYKKIFSLSPGDIFEDKDFKNRLNEVIIYRIKNRTLDEHAINDIISLKEVWWQSTPSSRELPEEIINDPEIREIAKEKSKEEGGEYLIKLFKL